MLFATVRTQSTRLPRVFSGAMPTVRRIGVASVVSGLKSSFLFAPGVHKPTINKYCCVKNFSTITRETNCTREKLIDELKLFVGSSATDSPTSTVEHLMNFFKKRGALPKELLADLLDHSIKYHKTLPNVLSVSRSRNEACLLNPEDPNIFSGNLTIVGDVHGQYDDFAQIFQQDTVGGYPTEQNQFIFNGDLVDRGPMALEIVTVLLVSKLLATNSIHILRGNHETRSMTQNYGFEKEVLHKYDRPLLNKFSAFFDTLPVAAVVENTAFVTHGGIGPETARMTVAQINELDRFQEPEMGPISELLWSDPKEQLSGFRHNAGRGGGTVCFGANVTEHFLVNNNFQVLVRSHEVMMQGFQTFHGGLCWSVFSAPNYCGDTGNLAAVVRFSKPDSMQAEVVRFKSVVPNNVFPPQQRQ